MGNRYTWGLAIYLNAGSQKKQIAPRGERFTLLWHNRQPAWMQASYTQIANSIFVSEEYKCSVNCGEMICSSIAGGTAVSKSDAEGFSRCQIEKIAATESELDC